MSRFPHGFIVLLMVFASAACEGLLGVGGTGDGGAGGGGGTPTVDVTGACSDNDAMMQLLAPSCASCHKTGINPFFASLDAFETHLVYNTKYVIPGYPAQSYLVALLNGEGAGAYKQMPLAGDSFAALAEKNLTAVSMARVSEWIENLKSRAPTTRGASEAPAVTRMSATQIRNTLYQQLGLSDADFFTAGAHFGTPMLSPRLDMFPLMSPDDPKFAASGAQVEERHGQLGGSQAFRAKAKDISASPPFALTMTGMSQRWCRLSVAKTDCPWLKHVQATQSSSTAEAAIKQNIAFMGRHFWAQQLTGPEVNEIYDDVFRPLETETNANNAWVGTCSYFVRHPLWVFY